MATKKETAEVVTETMETAKDTNVSTKSAYEPVYSIDELVNSGVLGTKPITAKTALKMANKTEYTVKEAMKVIEVFKKEAK